MPCYNSERTIAGSINSILTQTYKNWELIIVNDGCTDKTEEIIQGFQDKRIRYYRRPRLEIPATRNFGNSQARGDYIIIQDSDDYSFPDRLEKIARIIDAHHPDIILHDGYVNAWNAQYGCMERHYIKALPVDKKRIVREQYLPGWFSFKKSVWEKRPHREETKYSYDWMTHLDWIFSGYKYHIFNEALYEYVRYRGSASDRYEREGKRRQAFIRIKKILEEEYGVDTKEFGKNMGFSP